ncbi:helix-turn-helix domain-containing protein [Streptomyces sp. NPDC002851]
MSELSRSAGRLTELEVSCLPEVAALATELTTLFNGLGIPQQQYAARITMDKSTISRFLNGRRVATQDFIDRLLRELERHRQAPMTPETRSQLRSLRLAALKKTDPASFQLEHLRDELDRSHRVIKQLKRQQEALELLLDEREAEADEARREMHQLRIDWVSDRKQSELATTELTTKNEHLQNGQERLRREIEELREQLVEVTQLKHGAEEKCARLEERLLEVERELAAHLEELGEQSFALTPEEAAQEIKRSYSDQRYHDAARTLSLAAAHYSAPDIVKLWSLTVGMKRRLDAETLIRDAIRFRSAEFSANIVEMMLSQESLSSFYDARQSLGINLASSKSSADLDYLYERWKGGGPRYGVLRVAVVSWSETAHVQLVARLLRKLKVERDTIILVRMLHVIGLRPVEDVVAVADFLMVEGMESECRTLIERWYAAIPEVERSAMRKRWGRIATGVQNGSKLTAIFAEGRKH